MVSKPSLSLVARRSLTAAALCVGGATLATGSLRAQMAFDTAAVLASPRPDIAAANSAWLPGLQKKDANAITAAFADSAIFITADGAVVHGRLAITRMYEARFPLLGKIERGEVVSEGLVAIKEDLVYEWGHATLEMASATPGGPPRRGGGAYLTVWRRSTNGHWLIVRNLAM